MSENSAVRFGLTTLIGGVVFLVPLVILVVVVAKAAELMMLVAQPLAAWLPVDSIGGVALANLIVIVGLVLVCFIAGLVARHALAGAFIEKIESRVLINLPGYAMVRSLLRGFDQRRTEGLRPVAVQLGSAERVGYEIELLPDGRSMVFIPSPPNPFSGITQVLPPEQVTYLDVSLKEVMEVTENFGHGVHKILARKQQAPS